MLNKVLKALPLRNAYLNKNQRLKQINKKNTKLFHFKLVLEKKTTFFFS